MSAPGIPGLRRHGWLCLFVAVGLSVALGWSLRRLQSAGSLELPSGGSQVTTSGAAATSGSRGPLLFQVYCAKCHGSDGRGDPESIARLRPPPRDFAERPWKLPMTAESIRSVITDGIPGTAMAANRAALTAAEIDQLVDYTLVLVKQLPVVRRAVTEGERQLTALGFDVARQASPAPALVVEDARGTPLSLGDLQGGWVLLQFWGVSCAPCRATMPGLQRFSQAWIDKRVKVLPVCADADDARSAQELLSQHGPGLTAYIDATGIGLAPFDVQALPMTWIIDPQGAVRATRVGAIDFDSAEFRSAFAGLFSQGAVASR